MLLEVKEARGIVQQKQYLRKLLKPAMHPPTAALLRPPGRGQPCR